MENGDGLYPSLPLLFFSLSLSLSIFLSLFFSLPLSRPGHVLGQHNATKSWRGIRWTDTHNTEYFNFAGYGTEPIPKSIPANQDAGMIKQSRQCSPTIISNKTWQPSWEIGKEGEYVEEFVHLESKMTTNEYTENINFTDNKGHPNIGKTQTNNIDTKEVTMQKHRKLFVSTVLSELLFRT